MTENKDKIILPHSVLLKDRQELHLSGVTDVDSFDETGITAYTDLGELAIGGENLHITKLSLESGELLVEGKIISLVYRDEMPKATSFFGKVFRWPTVNR